MTFSIVKRGTFIAAFFVFAIALAAATEARAVTLYSVSTTNQLLRFDSATPGTIAATNSITGLQGGENILGIDFRPATGQLYGLGSTGRLYVINTFSGAATSVATVSVALSGTEFGVDFNPTVDRLRIVSNTGQNLRVNPADGVTTTDGAVNPVSTGVTAAAYTNNFNGATTTTLFTIDVTAGTLNTQNPPNNGTQVAVGPLGVVPTASNGFDFSSADNVAYAALTVGGVNRLYAVNTTTGTATAVGAIGAGTTNVRGLAAEAGPIASNVIVYGVTTGNQLVKFNSHRPNTMLSTVTVTGLQGGENILGIDFRPATGQLYGLGSTSRLYVINTVSGVATQVGAAGGFTLSGTDFGFDFNPVPDRIRVVSNTGQNFRINPNDGTAVTPLDTTLNPGTPSVTAAAYTNSFAGTATTTLYTIDTGADTINLQGSINGTPNSPNGGTQTVISPLGFDANGSNGFDISPTTGAALAALQIGADTTSKLFQININFGGATFVGPIGSPAPLRGLAIQAGSAASDAVDFDGDRKADYSIFRGSVNTWYVNSSSNNSLTAVGFGQPATDALTPVDFDGDERTDIAVWRSSNGTFYYIRSSDSAFVATQWGTNGDEPIARDYDGDSKADLAVVRRQGGQIVWYITNSANSSIRIDTFGLSTDYTSPGDFDGDGRFDLGVKRGNGSQSATYYIQRSRDGFMAMQWGFGSDLVVPGDYDGDGRTDITALRQGSSYKWYLLESQVGLVQPTLGVKPDLTTQADYDGDGRTDVSVWNQATGAYSIIRSTTGATTNFTFGQNGDVPVASFDIH